MILSKSSGKILPGQTRTSAQFCKADCECENEETAVLIVNIRQTDFQKGNDLAEYKLITTGAESSDYMGSLRIADAVIIYETLAENT